MQFSQPFFVAGHPTSMQFYPCFTPTQQPQPFQMYPFQSFNGQSYNGLSYNGPFQEVIGEGDVSSVVLPDGTVQMFFVPTTSQQKCKHCMQHTPCNACWNNNGPWFVRSVNTQGALRPPTVPYGGANYKQDECMALPPCPGFQQNQGMKFHNDRTTSTGDIGYFCPRAQERYDDNRGGSGVVCNAPCKCARKSVSYKERCDSDMSVDEPRRGKKRKKRNVDCECVSVCSIHCLSNRKRQKKRKYSSDSSCSSISSTTSSYYSPEEEKRKEKIRKECKKQCKKQEKERKKREKERDKEMRKRRKEREKQEKKIRKEKEKRQKAKMVDSCTCTDDKQMGDTPVCDKDICDKTNETSKADPNTDDCNACGSFLCRVGSAISDLFSNPNQCTSPSSTCSSCTSSRSSNSKLCEKELKKHEVVQVKSVKELKQLEKELKKCEAEQKKSEKELIKKITKEQKLLEKERKKREREQKKKEKEGKKALKQSSAAKIEKCVQSPHIGPAAGIKQPCCSEEFCPTSGRFYKLNESGKGNKATKSRTKCDCATSLSKQSDRTCPPSKKVNQCPYLAQWQNDQCNKQSERNKNKKNRPKSDCACRSTKRSDRSRSSTSLDCSCASAMSIDTNNKCGDSDVKFKTNCLKIIDISDKPCQNVAPVSVSPCSMTNRESETNKDISKVSQRHCGILCEGPPTANKQLATHADRSSCGIFTHFIDKYGIGVQCSDQCSAANSRASFGYTANDRDPYNIGPCAQRNPSCNPL